MGIRLRAAERRAQLGVARRLFARDGYRGASMESIAEAAGVTKPVLYQHFSSKRALYSALLANDLGRLTQELEAAFSQAEDNEERLRRGFGAYLDFVDRHEDAFRLLFTEALGLDADFQRQVTEFRRWVAARVARIIAAEAGLAPEGPGPGRGDRGHGRGRGRLVAGRAPAPRTGELADELAGLAWKGFARFPAESREPDVPVDPSSLA